MPFLYYRVMSKTSFETGPLAIFSMKVCRGMASLTPHITPTLTSILHPEQGRPGHRAAGAWVPPATHTTPPTPHRRSNQIYCVSNALAVLVGLAYANCMLLGGPVTPDGQAVAKSEHSPRPRPRARARARARPRPLALASRPLPLAPPPP